MWRALFLIQDRVPTDYSWQVTFFSLRPKNVLLASSTPHSTCHCKYHDNIFLFLEALHKACDKIPTYSSAFPESLVCDSPTHACYFNTCNTCKNGALFMQKYPLQEIRHEIDQSDSESDHDGEETARQTSVSWYQWEETTNTLGYSNLAKVLHEGDFSDLYNDFTKVLPKFLEHSFVKRNQAKAYEDCKAKLKDDPSYAIVQFDFSQNMTCEWQDAPMSTHWHKTQITIFTCVGWHQDQKLCKVIVSDDRGHNKESIIVFLDTLMEGLPKDVKIIDFWSDGPTSQFKNRFAAEIIRYLQEKYGVKIRWNYFATSHGKGPVDGIGAIIKRFVTQKIMTRKALVQDVRSFLDAARGCEIESVGKSKAEIEAFNAEHGMAGIFEKAEKIKDITQMHFMELDGGKCRTAVYNGKS